MGWPLCIRKLARLHLGLVGGLIVLGTVSAAWAQTVAPGFDLYQSGGRFLGPGSFFGVQVEGVPLGPFDFDTAGVQETFDTNFIVRRTAAADAPQAQVPLEIVAFQLQSLSDDIDLELFGGDAGETDRIGITLNQNVASSYDISFGTNGGMVGGDGAFTADLHFSVDIRRGGITGDLLQTRELELSTASGAVAASGAQPTPSVATVIVPGPEGIPWSHLPSSAVPELDIDPHLTIPGANLFLNAPGDQSQDFFPFGEMMLSDLSHEVFLNFQTAVVPLGLGIDNPFMPDDINEDGGFVFHVEVNPDDRFFFDPIVAIGYDFIVDGPLVTSVEAPILPGGDDEFDLVIGSNLFSIFGGIPFTLPDPASVFSIVGIDPGEGLDPADPLAFAVGFTFDTSGPMTLTMTPITFQTDMIPEPSTFVMFVVLGGVGFAARRRSRHRKDGRS